MYLWCHTHAQVLFKAMYDHLELVYHTDQASDEHTISKFPTAISRKALRCVGACRQVQVPGRRMMSWCFGLGRIASPAAWSCYPHLRAAGGPKRVQ
jgi:hypothetical protein